MMKANQKTLMICIFPCRVVGFLIVLAAAVNFLDPSVSAQTAPVTQPTDRGCTFMPESPAPSWIKTRPNIPGMYVGVGQAGKLTIPEAQIRAAEAAALEGLSSEIEVQIKSKLIVIETENSKRANTFAESKTESGIQQLLRNAQIQERWLDRANCMLWAFATVSELSVENVRQEIQKEVKRKFSRKKVMLFDLSNGQVDMAGFLLRDIEQLFRELGMPLIVPDNQFVRCAQETNQALCLEGQDTIYAGVLVAFENEELSADGQLKARLFRMKGDLRFQDRLVSSLDLTCRGIGYAGQTSRSLDRAAASECALKAGKIIRKDMEKSE